MWKSLAAFVVSAGVLVLWAVSQGLPVAVPEPPLDRLECVSYAHPENVLIVGKRPPIQREVIERELRAVAKMSNCIRVYSSDPRQDLVLPVAAELGLKVLLGAWVNSVEATSHADLDRAIALARKYPDTVKALIVGNEVLTVKEMPIEKLTPYLDEARARSPVPVTVAEVWSIWLDQPELAKHVDFLGVHVLPYWDGKPDSLEAALDFIDQSIGRIEARFPGKPILIAETGWPSGGRAKGGFPPGQVEQARFVRGVAALAARRHWSYNIVESYDQQWKRYGEGVTGGTWGILTDAGQPKFALSGPVAPHRSWQPLAMGTVLLGLLGYGVMRRRCVIAPCRWRLAGLVPLVGFLLTNQALFSIEWVSGWGRAALGLAAMSASAVLAWNCLLAVATGRRSTSARLGWLVIGYQLAALALCVEEPFKIPSDYYSAMFALPALAALLAVRFRMSARGRAFGWTLLGGAALAVALAGPLVGQVWLWALTVICMAAPLLDVNAFSGRFSLVVPLLETQRRYHGADRS